MESKKKESILMKDGVNYLVPFILITSCFALWGFANDITNPMVKAFSKIFRMSSTDGALVQVAFYGGYFAMAFPAAIFIRRFSYKAGVLLGLGLYAFGAFLFYPAKMMGEYYPFLLAYFILTCGLSFLETSSNPYILSMGTEETATRRLNLAQSFNPMGSLLGMYVAMNFIQAKLNPLDTAGRANLSDNEFEAIKEYDLSVLINPAEWKENGEEQQFDIILPLAEEAHINAIIPVDDAAFQNPASMQQAIIDYCATHQLQVPQTKAEIVRSVLQSLAAKYAEATAHLNEMLPQPIKCMHIIGGGSQNKLLNRLTSEALGVPVIAGPIEATGMGNILTQALAKGEIKDINALRAVVRQSI